MKQLLKKTMLLATLLLAMTQGVFADDDFTIDGLGFKITSQSNLEVELSSASGQETVVVPETVNFNNRTYTVTGIGEYAFGAWLSDNITLKKIEFPQTLIVIKPYAFSRCKNLTEIKLPNNVTTIEKYAFYYCTALAEAHLSSSLVSIEDYTFAGCASLSSIIIPSAVSNIRYRAFENCSSLTEVFFTSKSKPTIETYVFNGCHSALEQYVPSVEEYGFGIEYVSFNETEFTYNGMSPNVTWVNNLKAYNVNLEVPELEKNAGTYISTLKAIYSGLLDLTVEIPYTYTIKPASLSLTVNDCEREYGDENPQFSSVMTGFVEGENAETLNLIPTYSCEANESSSVGTYRILATVNPANYEVTYSYGTLSVKKAPIQIAVKNCSRIYGDQNPNFEYSYSGLKNNETAPQWITPLTVETTATKESPCGVYEVSVKNGEAKNYDIVKYTSGELTITKRDLTVRVNDCERLYGEDNPQFLLSYIGFVNNDDATVFTSTPTATCSATIESDAGTYAIVPSGGSAENYNFIYEEGTLTIKPLTIGFANTNNTVTYNDMDKSVHDYWFEYVPEIFGDYNKDDFWLTMYALDSENRYPSQHVRTITSGSYAGDYIIYEGPTYVGKYIFELSPKGTNPNVVASPDIAYLTVNKGAIDLVWDDPATITINEGDSVVLELSYMADLFCDFVTNYDENIVSLYSENATTNHPQWTLIGLQEGETELSFQVIAQNKNNWGNYNFYDSQTITKTIRVNKSTGIENVKANNQKEDKYYDLRGNRLSAPKRGVNIINGKKVIVK